MVFFLTPSIPTQSSYLTLLGSYSFFSSIYNRLSFVLLCFSLFGVLGLYGFFWLMRFIFSLASPLFYLEWKPLVLILSFTLSASVCLEDSLLTRGLRLSHYYASFLYFSGHLFSRS